jgi:hypothetical protein
MYALKIVGCSADVYAWVKNIWGTISRRQNGGILYGKFTDSS